MKKISKKISKQNKKRRRQNKAKLKKYWSLLEPPSYAAKMVAGKSKDDIKISSRLKEVPLKGVLRQTDDGFVYIKISNNVIHGLFTLIDEEGIEKPPYFSKNNMSHGIGAHISAISDEEIKDKDIKEIKEIGQEISFKLGEMKSTKPQGWEDMERVWFVTVECPEIEKIRERYVLPKTYKDLGHEWHMTIAVKKKGSKKINKEASLPRATKPWMVKLYNSLGFDENGKQMRIPCNKKCREAEERFQEEEHEHLGA